MINLLDIYIDFPLSATAVRPGAAEFLYELLRERPTEANISHQELPPFRAHFDYVLSKPYRHWYLVVKKDGSPTEEMMMGEAVSPVGAIYATRQNEIGIAIAAQHRRKGYAAQAITALRLRHDPLPAVAGRRPGHYVAHVATGNEPSKHLFEGLGAKPIAITYRLP